MRMLLKNIRKELILWKHGLKYMIKIHKFSKKRNIIIIYFVVIWLKHIYY